MDNINVHISLPKAIGESQTLSLTPGTNLLAAIEKMNQKDLLCKIMSGDSEFNRFVLIYHNSKRVKDPIFPLMNDCSIDVIIPMAGG